MLAHKPVFMGWLHLSSQKKLKLKNFQLSTLQGVHSKLSEERKSQVAELRVAKETAFEAENKLSLMSREYEQTKNDVGTKQNLFFLLDISHSLTGS